jgi:hypothetical protein
MGSRPKVGGYIWNAEVNRGLRANEKARRILDKLINDPPASQARLYQYVAAVSQCLSEELSALTELERIGRNERKPER